MTLARSTQQVVEVAIADNNPHARVSQLLIEVPIPKALYDVPAHPYARASQVLIEYMHANLKPDALWLPWPIGMDGGVRGPLGG